MGSPVSASGSHFCCSWHTAQGDAVVTDVEAVREAVDSCGAENVLCVVTTTSCFAPRLPDKVREA